MGLGIIPWSPLGGGILCGVLDKPNSGRRSRPALQSSVEKLRPQLERYENLCKELSMKPADLALAWVLSNPSVTSPIIGPRTIEQLQESTNVLSMQIPEQAMKKLDEIWPGPGNQAPEAYAW
jgi:aryl-alcohol dehydrogenase-like predicted oxidoreductase